MIGRRAAPAFRYRLAAERRQEDLRIGIGNRQCRNLQDDGRVFHGKPLGVGGGADARRQRIAGIERHVRHRAALEAVRRARRTFRIGRFDRVAVVRRIGIDDAADRAVLGGEPRLQSAPARAVARDDDLALDADTETLERLVVVAHAVIDIDERRRDVAIALIGEIGGQKRLLRARAGVARDRRFLQRDVIGLGTEKVDLFGHRRRIEHLECLDLRVPAERSELRCLPFRIRLVVRAADMIGLGRHELHPVRHLVRTNAGIEALFER